MAEQARPERTRLDSWKDIAAYLRRDVRTAIRWEKKKGLPVRRVPGGRRQAVFAYTEELDAWWRQGRLGDSDTSAAHASPVSESATLPAVTSSEAPTLGAFFLGAHLRSWWLKAGVLLFLAAGLAAFVMSVARSSESGNNPPVRVRFTSNSMQAFGDQSRPLWTHHFDGRIVDVLPEEGQTLADMARIADFRGDGHRGVLALVALARNPNLPLREADYWELDMFSEQGRELWSYAPQGKFRFGRHELVSWSITADLVSEGSNGKRIWVAAANIPWGNTFIANLDPKTGKETLRVVNTGTIKALNEIENARGRWFLAGGFNNENDTGSLAVMDERKAFASSPQTDGTRHKCASCPPGQMDYYFVFPRSELNELLQVHEDAVTQVLVRGNEIEVDKRETQAIAPKTIYLLRADDDGIHLVSRRFDSGYDMLHREMEKEGRLDHSLENCPERLHPKPVMLWTPSGRWKKIALTPMAANQ